MTFRFFLIGAGFFGVLGCVFGYGLAHRRLAKDLREDRLALNRGDKHD